MCSFVNPEIYNFLIENPSNYFHILDFLPDPDLILIADEDGYEFAVHKSIMFSGSTYFKPVHYDMKKILIENMPSEVLDLIITSIYGGTVHFRNFDFAKEILNIASKWGLKLLTDSATYYVCKNMTYPRSCDIFKEANKHQTCLIRCATNYVQYRTDRKNKKLINFKKTMEK